MQLKVFDEKEEAKTIRLRLFQEGGHVTLCAVDEDGDKIDKGEILHVTKDGIARFFNLNKNLGFKLDGLGQIDIVN